MDRRKQASHTHADAAALLKSITYQIQSVETAQLPYISTQAAAQLWPLRALFSSSEERLKKNSDSHQSVHRFKTQLSTLLQSRSIEGRWSGIVLLKAVLEAGGVAVVSSNGSSWIKYLLQILKKSRDPSSSRSLAAIAIVRIVQLTWDTPSLIREITTPNLPAFITTTLNNAQSPHCSSTELQTYLDALATLIPHHPAIFRPNESQIAVLCKTIITSTSNRTADRSYSTLHLEAAQRLFCSLHHCAPKQGGAEKWTSMLDMSIEVVQQTCDIVFRSVRENWISTEERYRQKAKRPIDGECRSDHSDAFEFVQWIGVHAGAQRLRELLRLLQTQLELATSNPVSFKMGRLLDLLVRICSIGPACSANHEVAADERVQLYGMLGMVQTSAVQVMISMVARFGTAISPLRQTIFETLAALWEQQQHDGSIRRVLYTAFTALLECFGMGFAKQDIADFVLVLKACCKDIMLRSPLSSNSTSASDTNGQTILNGGQIPIGSAAAESSHPTSQIDLETAAQRLLPVALAKLDARFMPASLRALLDRTAILTRNKEAMLASVLNPPVKTDGSKQASILPLLARSHPQAAEVEALLRPRMPVITRRVIGVNEEEEEDAGDDFEVDDAEATEDSPDGSEHQVPSLAGEQTTVLPSTNPLALEVSDEEATMSGTAAENDVKRNLATADEEREAKRVRFSVAETSQEPDSDPIAMTATLGPDTRPAITSDQAMGAPAYGTAQYPATIAADEEDDDSDFEMPPLTLASDSEVEDE